MGPKYFLASRLVLLLAPGPGWHASAQILQAPAWPIAVKNPYLNSWYSAGPTSAPLNSTIVSLWNTIITSWYLGINVDGLPYRIMGSSNPPTVNVSNQVSVQMTPTRTIVETQAGPINLTMDFMSPIDADDLIRQSVPFSYLAISAASIDGKPHSVNVYSDVSSEWITTNLSDTTNSAEDTQNVFVSLQSSLNTSLPFVEIQDFAQDSTSVFALKNTAGVKYQIGLFMDVRNLGMNSTGLQDNIADSTSATDVIVRGISVDLGQVIQTTSPMVFAIGVVRDPSIQFVSLSSEAQLRSSYYRMNFTTSSDVVSFFLDDYDNASNQASRLDSQISTDALKTSSKYSELLSLVARQAVSSIEITVSKNVDGSFNSSDIMAFMKDMGNVGVGGVNAVDVLYAAFPMYMYLNPNIGGYLLRPLLVAQDTPEYTQPYAAQGLGSNFLNATVENIAHNFGIEQSGNMIIMLLAHLQATGDGSLVNQYYDMIKDWADYLVQNSLNPGPQYTSPADAINAINQTNLALKGIIGIGAMARISDYMGKGDDGLLYANTSQTYIGQWQNLSISQDKTHLLTSFGSNDSTGLIYNLYADKLLQLDLVPQSVSSLSMVTEILNKDLTSSKFGIPLDSGNETYTRADWMMFAAAASTNDSLRSSLIDLVHFYAFTPTNNTPFTPLYDPTTGKSLGGSNSPSLGAFFSVLALEYVTVHSLSDFWILTTIVISKSFQVNITGVKSKSVETGISRKKLSLIIGASVIGGVVCFGFLSYGLWIYRKRLQKRTATGHSSESQSVQTTWRVESHSQSTLISSSVPPALQRRSTTILEVSENLTTTIRRTRREAAQVNGTIPVHSMSEIEFLDAPPPYTA
ncbi:DUF1793-domain-containing protein [Schizopora paradoxa]|uniref:DUF1793-domain-containing protein n=1 Tax=Schizopora paradoxa TaxID=27342 RepID=A0A0H2RDV0_9AGAM|nr:DUF1793-domain-containing protein [Schizopora paradoxa]